MSCEFRLVATIEEISTLKKYLFPRDELCSDNWLQLCEISVSPTGDIIAIGHERTLVVLTSKWDSEKLKSRFHITYSGPIHEYDKIKAVLCLPVVGQSQSLLVEPDWTCILIGFDSGYIRFYTDDRQLILEEQLHSENITHIKCQSQHSPRPDICTDLHPEEIYVQYQSTICILNGPELFAILNNSFKQHLKGQARGDEIQLSQHSYTFKKWGFQDQTIINDSAVGGLILPNTFDHLVTASTCGGFDSQYRAIPPNSTLVLAAGSTPFLGYHYALEGVNQPVLSDVAKVVANKLRSTLPSWLTGVKAQPEKQITLSQQVAEAMGCRFGLCDLRRTASNITLSQDRKLAAVTDTLGRVLLIDAFRGVILKIFKGYRDAQCAFIQVPDERRSKHRVGNKIAHFLVIYSPKRATIEVFATQKALRISIFSASRFSRLLYIDYGLMGFTTNTKSRYVCQFTTVFIDSDGQIKELLIPFHFALAERNNKRAHDIHLYKKLRHFLKCSDFDTKELFNVAYTTCTELKTSDIKSQVINMLLSNKNVPSEVILECVQYFINNLEESEFDLKTLCVNANVLLKFYIFVSHHGSSSVDNIKTEKSSYIMIEEEELHRLNRLLNLCSENNRNKLKETHVSFSDVVEFKAADFVSAFDITKPDAITLNTNVDENILFKVSQVLFKNYIVGNAAVSDEFIQEILKSKISARNLFHLVINYWINRPLDVTLKLDQEINNLGLLIQSLLKATCNDVIMTEYNTVSKFWTDIRETLADSSRPFPALMAAMLCRSVIRKIELENSASSVDEDNIEMLSQENICWSILIGRLDYISLLNIILTSRVHAEVCSLPKLCHEPSCISLKYILEKGKGSVSELVAQWLTCSGIDPNFIVAYDLSKNRNNEAENNEELPEGISLEMIEQSKSEPLFTYLSLLREQFPYSLNTSILLANMCWEYAIAWQKEIQDLNKLEAALVCLGCITNINIKQGMYQLMWNTHLKIILESSCKLINKVGRLPKERLCIQDTGLSDKQMSCFIGICTGFLESFMDTVQLACSSSYSELQFEDIWENSSQPLVELANQQKPVNYNLLILHYQMSQALHMITTFYVKYSKPISNLFEPSTANFLFSDMQRILEINYNNWDVLISSSRVQFLCKIITASLELVTVEENKIYCDNHVKWMAKCINLAYMWNLDVDMLKIYQITQLYSNGYDPIAEELIPAVNDSNDLGVKLLVIAAKRLSQFMSSSPSLSVNIAAFSPVLTKYMDTLTGEWCAPSSLYAIKSIASHALQCIHEDSREYKLAELLIESCSNLEEIHSKQ